MVNNFFAGTIVSATACGLFLSSSLAVAATLLFDGTGLPTSQGWSVSQGAPVTVTPQTGTANDTLTVSTSGPGFYLAAKDILANSFAVSARVAVSGSSHNQFDAGFMFGALGGPQGSGYIPDRFDGLYIDPAAIGFMDNVGPTALGIDATQFHEYALRFDNGTGTLSVYIDKLFSAVVAGTALPSLTRTLVTAEPYRKPGVVFFGDQTNDSGFNSTFVLDYVLLEAFDSRGPYTSTPPPPPIVPIPPAVWLFGSALGLMGVMRRKISS